MLLRERLGKGANDVFQLGFRIVGNLLFIANSCQHISMCPTNFGHQRGFKAGNIGHSNTIKEAVHTSENRNNLFFNWQIRVERNAAFSDLQSDPRYIALLDRIREKIRDERLAVTELQQAFVQFE